MTETLLKIEHYEFRIKITKETCGDPILKEKLLKYYDKVIRDLRSQIQ